MKRVFLFAFLIAVCAVPSFAACTGSGTAWSCASSDTITDIATAYSSASNGATITFSTGTYPMYGTSGNSNAWFKPANSKGVTLQCASQVQDACHFKNTFTDFATSGAGSTHITSATAMFRSDMAGDGTCGGASGGTCIIITGAGTNFVPGTYFITSYVSATEVVVSSSPTPSGAGSGATGHYFVNPITFTNITGTNTDLYRFSGLTFDGIVVNNYAFGFAAATANGAITKLRIDHNWFENIPHQQEVIVIQGTGQCVEVYGVIDHNSMVGADSFHPLDWSDTMTPAAPCPAASRRGTANNLFVEDNTFTMTTNPNPGGQTDACIDGFGNGAVVWRFNDSTNCQHLFHGVVHGGGPANVEWYGNNCIRDSNIGGGLQDGSACYWSQGAGLFLAFNNLVTPAMGAGESGVAIDNQYSRSFYNDTDGNNWGRMGTDYSGAGFTGTADVQSNIHCSKFSTASYIGGIFWSMAAEFGTVAGGSQNYKFLLYDSSDNLLAQSSSLTAFGPNLDNYAFTAGTSSLSASTSYTFCIFGSGGGDLELFYRTGSSGDEIIDTTATWPTAPATLTHSSTGNKLWSLAAYNTCDGTAPTDDPATSGWPGNNSPTSTYRGYPCWHQPGRDYSGNLNPQIGFNNYFTGTLNRIDAGAFSSGSAPTGSPDYSSQHIQRGRDFLTDDGSGATAITVGTSLPATCTPTPSTLAADSGKGGQGFWKLNSGSWNTTNAHPYQYLGTGTSYTQGEYYQCSATNTWTLYYTPYTYPHDLVTNTDSLSFTTQPTDVVSGANFSPTVVVTCLLPAGGTDTSCTGTVTLAMSACGATLTGGATLSLSSGVATFTSRGATGSATGCNLSATLSGGTTATGGFSNSFNVTSSCTPDHLTFTAQPSDAIVNASLGTVTVAVKDSGGSTCTSATNAITIANKSATCTGMTLGGTTSGNASSGLFTVTDLTENAAGSCTLHATASGLTAADSNAFTISSGAPTLTTVSPSSGTQGNAYSMSITGTGFDGGNAAVNVSGTGITVSNIVVVSPTNITCTFTLSSNAATSARDVTVTTDDGTSNAVTFEVNSAAVPGTGKPSNARILVR